MTEPVAPTALPAWQLALQLGWRNLWRDFRAGELNLLLVSVVLAVAALSAVGFFADRLQAGLWRDARQLLLQSPPHAHLLALFDLASRPH